MVYRGRPSTGCKKCRERKVKVSIELRYFYNTERGTTSNKGMQRVAVAVVCRNPLLAASQLGILCETLSPEYHTHLHHAFNSASLAWIAD
jgi:hypothetical protein